MIKYIIALLGQMILRGLYKLDNYAIYMKKMRARSRYGTDGMNVAEITKKTLGGYVYIGGWISAANNAKVQTFSRDDKVVIGKYCSIAERVILFGGGEHGHRDRVSTFHFRVEMLGELKNTETTSRGVLKIGNDVWIGEGAMIMSGIEICDGAVIGMGSVVSKSIPPYAIVVGNPARIIGYRFSAETIDTLLKIKWWDWGENKIIDAIDDLEGNIESFITKYAP